MPLGLPEIPLAFLAVSLLIELTPGPNMTYLAITSTMYGRKAGLATVAGITLGLLTIGIISAFGAGVIISESAVLYELLRWTGVLYLLWLAYEGWRGEKETSASKADSGTDGLKFFKRGLITNLLNPKAAVFYIATLPTFITSAHDKISQAIALTVVYVLIGLSVHTTIALASARARVFLEDKKTGDIIRRCLSALLAVVAIWFAFSTRR